MADPADELQVDHELTPTTPTVPARAPVSAVVCVYTDRRWELMLEAIDSLLDQRPAPAEVLVVVDHNPELAARLRQLDRPITVLTNQQHKGLSGARNTGVEAATSPLVAFFDDDARAEPGCLAALAAAFADPDVLGAGGWADAAWERGRPGWFPTEFDWVVGCSYTGLPTEPARVRNLIGCCMMIRRDVFERVGGFDHGIGRVGTRPVGCEETEFCIRANAAFAGGRFVLAPAARLSHFVPGERGSWHYFRSRCYAEGLSKAVVASRSSRDEALESERRYATRVLPAAVVRGVARSARERSGDGLRSSAAVVAGLALTTAGFTVGTVQRRRAA